MGRARRLSRRRRQRGFTLLELLLAVLVASMVVGGLAGITATASRTQAASYRHGALAHELSIAMQAIRADVVRAHRIYQPNDYNGSATTDFFYGSWCDWTLPANQTNEKCFQLDQGPTLDFFWYCRINETQPDGSQVGKLYRYTPINTPGPNYRKASGEPTGPGWGLPLSACGTGSPDLIASHIDSFTVARAAAGFTKDTITVTIGGSWTPAGMGTETLTQTSRITYPALYLAGP